MLTYNTMRFGTDTFTASTDDGGPVIGARQALLVSNEALDATAATTVDNFVVNVSQPSGTQCAFMFKIDNKVYKFNGSNLSEYTGEITADNVLANGNSVAQISALSNITPLVGKLIYPIIALKSSGTTNPTAKIGLKVSTSTATKSKTVTTAQFALPSPPGTVPLISDIAVDSDTTGNGSVKVTARIKDASGTWSAYKALTYPANKTATDIQFKIVYSVENIGVDSAKVNSITVNYTANNGAVVGNDAEIFSVIPDFETNLRLCYLVIRHKKLVDSRINAFASFFPTPKHREFVSIGNGTGAQLSYTLGDSGVPDRQIDPHSLRVYIDGVLTSSYEFNTETSEITLTAPSGSSILADYDYDCGLETWHPMTLEFFQQPYHDGTYMTRFSYALPDDSDATLANIRIQLLRPTGTVTSQSLGKATGKAQKIVLPHVAKPGTISFNAASYSYDFDTRVLTFTAAKNTNLKISYSYIGEQHKIFSWAAGWSAA